MKTSTNGVWTSLCGHSMGFCVRDDSSCSRCVTHLGYGCNCEYFEYNHPYLRVGYERFIVSVKTHMATNKGKMRKRRMVLRGWKGLK